MLLCRTTLGTAEFHYCSGEDAITNNITLRTYRIDMGNDDMLNDTGKELADALGMSQDQLLGGIKSTQYNLAWMKVENASLEPEGRNLENFERSLGRAYRGMVEALSDALDYNNVKRMADELQHIDSEDGQILLSAVQILEQISVEGLVDVEIQSNGTPDVYVETMDEAVKLAERLKKAELRIKSTDIHAELIN